MKRRYEAVGHLHLCLDCTRDAVDECGARPGSCATDHRVLVLDETTHDRWHNELDVKADPAQAAMF